MAVYVIGVVGIVVFYALVFAVGVWAARRNKEGEEETMLAGRNIGVVLGSITVAATWIGGGYINGTAEVVFENGLASLQAAPGYTVSLIVAGTFFAKYMRKRRYITILDPFQEQFGIYVGALMYIPSALGEIFWSAAILSALGATVSVVMDFNRQLSVIVSACIAVSYTLIGGLYSVIYTDIIQLFCMVIGLWISLPFAITNEAVSDISTTSSKWIGSFPINYGNWIDQAFLLMFGGFPWQMYFQRILACKSAKTAQIITYVAAAVSFVMTIPPILIGAIGASTDWSKTDLYRAPVNATNDTTFQFRPDPVMILPLVLRHLTPNYIAFFGLGAISAAVMSSMDSSFLACGSMFTHNIYKPFFRKKASNRELLWVLRAAILLVGAAATLMSLTVEKVYPLFTMCSDIVYVVLFPQLVCVMYVPFANAYGSLVGFIVALTLRILGGEQLIGLPAVIKFPYYSDVHGQMFPFRTLSMVCSLILIVGVSYLMKFLFNKEILSGRKDFLRAFKDKYDVNPQGFTHEIEMNTKDGNGYYTDNNAPGHVNDMKQ